MPLQVELVSPERVAYSGEAKMVVCRTAGGDIAFQPGHVRFVGTLATHPVRIIHDDGSEVAIAVAQGFVEVSQDNVTLLSDVCELSSDIDVGRAQAAKLRAEEALRADADDEDAASALRRAEVRLEVANAKTVGAAATH